jgi:hypothetical protein
MSHFFCLPFLLPFSVPLPTVAFITTPLLATLLLQNPSEPFGLPYRYYNSWNSLHLHLLHPQIQHKNFTKHFAPALCIVQITSKALCIATVPLFSWISSSDEWWRTTRAGVT